MDVLFTASGFNAITESQMWSILIACIMMVADIVAGFTSACILHNIQSVKMREGIGHKVLMLILIAVSYVLGVGFEHITNSVVNIPSIEIVCGYIIVMEIASVLENISKAYPEFVNSSLFKYLKRTQIDGGVNDAK